MLIGGGGHGRVVADMAETTGDYRIIAVADDKFTAIELKSGVCYGPPAMVRKLLRTDIEMQAIIAIGDNRMRFMMAERLGIALERYALIIHPGAYISQYAAISRGTVIMPGAVVNTGARIDSHAIINSGAIIEHDAEIGPFAHISPGAALAGGVRVGEGAHVGIGASVIQSVRLGSWSILGAGGAAIRDIPGGTTAVGVPARPIPPYGKTIEA
ncbi:putative acetyltransferase EpsM [Paenibacillus nasutitermitis]|uniref:Acetyltransferase EpsM n=1 Tax=Paenibacillus nasutitermitis TaxID=1652958 RepID=A0A916YX82_9BACL|nr:putative acetyltransferase EpsM [Paenibacillus nasutitermitis]